MTDPGARLAIRRRVVLAGAAAIPVLAACGSDDDGASSGGSPSESESSSAATDGPSETPSESGGGTVEGTRFAVADVPVEGGVIEGKIVVTQPSEGTFKAFDSTCTHQGCAVNKVEDNTIVCPCHGSQYSAEDGSVIQGPANGALTELQATVDGSDVVVA